MKILKYIKNPMAVLVRLDQMRIIHIDDEFFLKTQFKSVMGEKLDLKNPKTFNEKLQWLKIHDLNPDYKNLVDKYEAKKIIGSLIGDKYIIPTYGVYKSFAGIDFDKLPDNFVIKTTHFGGGDGVFLVEDKNKMDKDAVRSGIEKILKQNLYYFSRELPYKDIEPRIIIEEYLSELNDKECIDYKFMCFNGKVEYIFTCTERFSEEGLKVTFFDKNWNVLPFERSHPKSNKKIAKPYDLQEMIKMAEKISNGIPFVRVDFYNPRKGVIKFGEMTFYPGAGLEAFQPKKYDRILGDLIDLEGVDAR